MRKPALSEIRIDLGTQPRCEINYDTVREYAESIMDGAEFPSITVFYDGAQFILADGFHRYHAYAASTSDKFTDRCVTVKTGGLRDAILFGCSANSTHGLRRTNEDKRKTAMILLEDPEWCKWSNAELAKNAGVSRRFVDKLRNEIDSRDRRNAKKRADRAPEPEAEPHRKVKRGDTEYTMKVRHEPEPGPPVDHEGQLVTEGRLIAVFEDTTLDDMLKQIQDMRATLKRRANDPLFAYVPVPECVRSLKEVYDAIKAARPHTVTPAGVGRKYEDIGFLTKQQYDRLDKGKRHDKGTEAQ